MDGRRKRPAVGIMWPTDRHQSGTARTSADWRTDEKIARASSRSACTKIWTNEFASRDADNGDPGSSDEDSRTTLTGLLHIPGPLFMYWPVSVRLTYGEDPTLTVYKLHEYSGEMEVSQYGLLCCKITNASTGFGFMGGSHRIRLVEQTEDERVVVLGARSKTEHRKWWRELHLAKQSGLRQKVDLLSGMAAMMAICHVVSRPGRHAKGAGVVRTRGDRRRMASPVVDSSMCLQTGCKPALCICGGEQRRRASDSSRDYMTMERSLADSVYSWHTRGPLSDDWTEASVPESGSDHSGVLLEGVDGRMVLRSDDGDGRWCAAGSMDFSLSRRCAGGAIYNPLFVHEEPLSLRSEEAFAEVSDAETESEGSDYVTLSDASEGACFPALCYDGVGGESAYACDATHLMT